MNVNLRKEGEGRFTPTLRNVERFYFSPSFSTPKQILTFSVNCKGKSQARYGKELELFGKIDELIL